MKITEKALSAITESNELIGKLADLLGCSLSSITRYLSANENNGDLTKEVCLLAIEEKTGLTRDEILETATV